MKLVFCSMNAFVQMHFFFFFSSVATIKEPHKQWNSGVLTLLLLLEPWFSYLVSLNLPLHDFRFALPLLLQANVKRYVKSTLNYSGRFTALAAKRVCFPICKCMPMHTLLCHICTYILTQWAMHTDFDLMQAHLLPCLVNIRGMSWASFKLLFTIHMPSASGAKS